MIANAALNYIATDSAVSSVISFVKNLSFITRFGHAPFPANISSPSQEAYCVSKTKSLNKKILPSSVLCSFKFSIITV